MKKAMSFLLACAMLAGFCIFAQAAGTPYLLSELHLRVTLPDGWTVYTNATETSKITSPNVFLVADLGGDASKELTIFKYETDRTKAIFDLKQLEALGLNPFMEAKPVTDTIGADAIKDGAFKSYRTYRHPQALFVKLTGKKTESGQQISTIQYYTCINGQDILINYRAIGADISGNTARAVQSLVKGIRFDAVQPIPKAATDVIEAGMKEYSIKMPAAGPAFSLNDVLLQGGIAAVFTLIFPVVMLLRKKRLSAPKAALLLLANTAVVLAAQAGALTAMGIGITLYPLLLPAVLWGVIGWLILRLAGKKKLNNKGCAR